MFEICFCVGDNRDYLLNKIFYSKMSFILFNIGLLSSENRERFHSFLEQIIRITMSNIAQSTTKKKE
jgi:hypothetical protein